MIEAVRDFLRSIGAPDAGHPSPGAGDDPRVAAAALLFHVSDADGVVSEGERQRLQEILAGEFGLDGTEASRIAEAGREADADAVDLYAFTSVLKQHLSEERRAHFVELMWDMTYADGLVHELEDNIIWRVAELLGVSARQRMLGKRDAARRGGTG